MQSMAMQNLLSFLPSALCLIPSCYRTRKADHFIARLLDIHLQMLDEGVKQVCSKWPLVRIAFACLV